MKLLNLLATVSCMTIAGIALGQNEKTDYREQVTFGLKAGMNYSKVYNSSTEEFRADGKIGFAGGAVLTIPLGKYLGVQPEILLSQKGFKGHGSFFGSDYDFKRTTTYVDIPLQIAFKPTEFITIVAGPQYSYLIKQKDAFNSAFIKTLHEEEFNNDNIRRNILGFVTGVDINMKHIVLGTRVGWDITNNHGNGTSNSPQYKNLWFQGTIGYTFYKDYSRSESAR